MLVLEGIHSKLETRSTPRLQIGKFGVPNYFVQCYRMIGAFLFGAAVEQTTTNILKTKN